MEAVSAKLKDFGDLDDRRYAAVFNLRSLLFLTQRYKQIFSVLVAMAMRDVYAVATPVDSIAEAVLKKEAAITFFYMIFVCAGPGTLG